MNTQVTTVRKLFTLVYIDLFSKTGKLSMYQWACVLLVFVGVYIGELDGGKHGGAAHAVAPPAPAAAPAAEGAEGEGSSGAKSAAKVKKAKARSSNA